MTTTTLSMLSGCFISSEVDLDKMAATLSSPLAKKKSLKTGWLRKQGGKVRSWHRRWFILNGDMLFYYAKEDDAKPVGTIYLPGNRVIEHAFRPDEPEKFLFEILPADQKLAVQQSHKHGKGHTRMTPGHESYLMSASSDAERQDWIKHIRRVMFRDVGGAIFGQKIEETMEYEKKVYPERKIPYIIEECVEFLTRHGLDVEGIFRLPGRTLLIRELKEAFDCGERLKLTIEDHDVHTVASLLKLYLRQLPESIIPNNFYQKFMNVALRYQEKKDCDHIGDLRTSLALLPEDNYTILHYMCRFIHKVGENQAVNKMGEMNLATVFGPNIIRHLDDNPELFMATADLTHELAFLLIHHHEEVFTAVFNSKQPVVAVDDLLGLGDDQMPNDPPMMPSSDILSAVTTELGIVFEQSSAKLQDPSLSTQSSVDSGVEVRSSSLKEKRLEDLPMRQRPIQRSHVKSLSLPARPIPPKRKSKMKKKVDLPGGDQGSVTDPSSPECTPTTPDKWFDSVQCPTSWNGPSKNRGHVVYSEDSNSEVVVSNSDNGPLVFSPTEALQQQNDVLKETLSRTKSKYESQQKSLIADRDNLVQNYEKYISGLEQRHLAQVEELRGKQDQQPIEKNSVSDLPQYTRCTESQNSTIEPTTSEILQSLKDEQAKTKSKYDAHVKSLMGELTNMKQKYDSHIEGLESRNEAQMSELRRQLDKEKANRAEAVSRIMSLQSQLHRYHMTYGELPGSS